MKCLGMLVLPTCLALPCMSQQMVTEPSTGKTFPKEVTFKQGESSYTVTLTGTAVRKKFIFKVYGMAHYMQDPIKGSKSDVFKSILTDGRAKQISMEFVRDVELGKIQDAYRDGFKNNATSDELRAINDKINTFIGYFTKDVKENDEFVLRWLPGGTVIAVVQGEEKPPITDLTFAKVLWTIWFGDDSIVDRDDLVSSILQ